MGILQSTINHIISIWIKDLDPLRLSKFGQNLDKFCLGCRVGSQVWINGIL